MIFGQNGNMVFERNTDMLSAQKIKSKVKVKRKRHTMKLKAIIITCIICSISTLSISQNVQNMLDNYMQQIRTVEYANSPDKAMYSQENAPLLLNLLGNYYSESLPKVRLQACYLTYKAAKNVSNAGQKQNAVMVLVNGLKDPDSGNVGIIASWLTDYKKEDFNQEAKDSLESILKRKTLYRDKIVKLVAFVGLANQVEYIKSGLSNGIFQTTKEKWAAHLALARLGVEEEIDFCLDIVKSQGVNDDVIYELVPDLIYTRQQKCFDYIIELLQSKARNCMSANPESTQKIMCGYRIMEYLAPVIKDFPLEADSTGDLVVDDYEKALIDLRAWFTKKQGNYEIIKNTY